MNVYFDFDGTLTKKSTISRFYFECFKIRPTLRSILCIPVLLKYIVGRESFEISMSRCGLHLLSGMLEADLKTAGFNVAKTLHNSGLWPNVLKAWEGHGVLAHTLHIVTGGFSYVASSWVELSGYEAIVVGSELMFNAQGCVIGVSRVCVEGNKLVAIAGQQDEFAYGNSRGDYEMLASVRCPMWVDRDGNLSPWLGDNALK